MCSWSFRWSRIKEIVCRPETGFFYEVKANIDSFSAFQPVLPYPPQEMLDFQLFNQVKNKLIKRFILKAAGTLVKFSKTLATANVEPDYIQGMPFIDFARFLF